MPPLMRRAGLFCQVSGKVKPHTGQIYSVGELVQDKKIKVGKVGIFHQGTGQTIDYEGTEYLVLDAFHVIGVV